MSGKRRTIDMLDGYVSLSEEPLLDDDGILLQDATEGVKFAEKSEHCHVKHEFCDAVTYTPSMPSLETIFSTASSSKRFADIISMAYVNDNTRMTVQTVKAPCCPDHQYAKGHKTFDYQFYGNSKFFCIGNPVKIRSEKCFMVYFVTKVKVST